MLDTSALSPLLNSQQGRSASGAAGMIKSALEAQDPKKTAHIDTLATEFEALFLAQMLDQMFGDSLGDDMFGDEETREIYKGLMVNEYGKQIAAAGGIGIAPYVKQELLKLQEV